MFAGARSNDPSRVFISVSSPTKNESKAEINICIRDSLYCQLSQSSKLLARLFLNNCVYWTCNVLELRDNSSLTKIAQRDSKHFSLVPTITETVHLFSLLKAGFEFHCLCVRENSSFHTQMRVLMSRSSDLLPSLQLPNSFSNYLIESAMP